MPYPKRICLLGYDIDCVFVGEDEVVRSNGRALRCSPFDSSQAVCKSCVLLRHKSQLHPSETIKEQSPKVPLILSSKTKREEKKKNVFVCLFLENCEQR